MRKKIKLKKTLGEALRAEAARLATILLDRKVKVVFAESCTGGMVSSTLAEVPGISECLCGSAVVYRDATKAKWLGISAAELKASGAVSHDIAASMAESILKKTPEAKLAAAVTGHLGPDAPSGNDGKIFIAVTMRDKKRTLVEEFHVLPELTHHGIERTTEKLELRIKRQMLASHAVLFMVRSLLELTEFRKQKR